MSYRLSQQARQDLLEIWAYIAGDSEPAADRFIDLVVHHFQILASIPTLAAIAATFARGPQFRVGQYIIFYRLQTPGVQIMHIIHSKRDIDYLFRK